MSGSRQSGGKAKAKSRGAASDPDAGRAIAAVQSKAKAKTRAVASDSAFPGGHAIKRRLDSYFVDQHAELATFVTDLTCRLVRQRTVNVPASQIREYPYMDSPGQEERVASLLLEEAGRLSLEAKLHEKVSGRPNFVAAVGKGRKKLMIPCHMDVAPPGTGWKTNPFEPVVKGGYIVGRGTLDNKGPLAAALITAYALKPFERQLKGQLLIVGYSDHEVGATNGKGGCGMDFLLSEGIVKPDFAIIPDVGKDLRAIGVAEKGRMIVKVRATGKQVHGALPEKGDNAIMKMMRFLHRLSSMSLPYKPHELMGRPTVNVGEIRGGTSASMVPAECEVSLDVRYLPGLKTEVILGELSKIAVEAGGSVDLTVESDVRPSVVDPDNILVRSIQENTATMLGYEVRPAGTGISTCARELTKSGALAVGFGPGNDAVYASANEYVEVDQLLHFSRILAGVVIDLFT
jgi:acetylornithine deacetylase/succinyl-diaminopimelate desuccinylase-like protein